MHQKPLAVNNAKGARRWDGNVKRNAIDSPHLCLLVLDHFRKRLLCLSAPRAREHPKLSIWWSDLLSGVSGGALKNRRVDFRNRQFSLCVRASVKIQLSPIYACTIRNHAPPRRTLGGFWACSGWFGFIRLRAVFVAVVSIEGFLLLILQHLDEVVDIHRA